MNDSDTFRWLCKIRKLDSKKVCRRPGLIEIEGATLTAATNNQICVYLLRKVSGLLPFAYEDGQKILKFWRDNLPPGETKVPLAQLKAWAGTVPLHVVCPNCEGAGVEFSPDAPCCHFCDGDCVLCPEEVPVVFYGMTVNQNLISLGLAGLEADEVTIRIPKANSGDDGPFVIDAADWRLCIMPLDVPKEMLKTLPRYPEES